MRIYAMAVSSILTRNRRPWHAGVRHCAAVMYYVDDAIQLAYLELEYFMVGHRCIARNNT